MASLSPTDIRELRLGLNWSAREMGDFLNRTGVTIYHWEGGKTTPGRTMQALLAALQRDLYWKQHSCTDEELRRWSEDLLDHGVEALLRDISEPVIADHDGPSAHQMVEKACRQGGTAIQSSSGRVLAYLVPNTTADLLQWAHHLLDMSAEAGGRFRSSPHAEHPVPTETTLDISAD